VSKKLFAMVIFSLVCMAGPPHRAAGAKELQVAVQPNQILMGATYNGQSIAVTGTMPADAMAIIRVTGHAERSKLKKKGRALGVLWMNLDAVEISNVPNVFLLYLPEGVQAAPQMDRPSRSMAGLGMEAIRKQADIESKDGDKDALFGDFVKLKQKAGLYATVPDAIGYAEESKDVKSFHCTVSMPSTLPQGTYQLEVFAIDKDNVVSYASQQIEAKEVGLPAFISSLAFQHGALYGVLAVLVAVMAGLLTGVMFKGGEGAH
jgi:uncharacterized protein (TIGR02186 family)